MTDVFKYKGVLSMLEGYFTDLYKLRFDVHHLSKPGFGDNFTAFLQRHHNSTPIPHPYRNPNIIQSVRPGGTYANHVDHVDNVYYDGIVNESNGVLYKSEIKELEHFRISFRLDLLHNIIYRVLAPIHIAIRHMPICNTHDLYTFLNINERTVRKALVKYEYIVADDICTDIIPILKWHEMIDFINRYYMDNTVDKYEMKFTKYILNKFANIYGLHVNVQSEYFRILTYRAL